MLSAYRIMWMMVLFDLPTFTKKHRKEAQQFRLFLQDEGFSMCQFSVYLRVAGNQEKVETLAKRIEQNLPAEGTIQILVFTDRQYGNIRTFHGRGKKQKPLETPNQYALF